MSEDLRKTGIENKPAKKAVTSTPALILVMLVEFVMFAFYPFMFLVIIPYQNYDPYPENFFKYHNEEKKVVLKKNIHFASYLNWETNIQGDENNKLTVPKGSTIEVAQVDMNGYPEGEPEISISFYYDEEGKGYTLWGGVKLDWIENPEEIFNDLDALRAAEKQNNKNAIIKTITGFVITIVAAAVAVLVLFLILKKNMARHVLAASILVLIVYVLLFIVGPIGSDMYYDALDERLGI